MINTKGFRWQSQLQRGIRKLPPFTPCSQLLVLELNEDWAPASEGKGIARYFGGSALTLLNSLPLQNLKGSAGGREIMVVEVTVVMVMMKEENADDE